MPTRHFNPQSADSAQEPETKAIADLLESSLADGEWLNSLTRQIEETMELIAEELKQSGGAAIGPQPENPSTPEIPKPFLEISTEDLPWG